jgi:hypothetical protein
VGIKNSPAACHAEAADTLALWLLFTRISVARWSWRQLREAQADLPLDPGAIGAQSFCLELGNFVANSTNLLDRSRHSSVEETQTCLEHHGPLFRRTREDGGPSPAPVNPSRLDRHPQSRCRRRAVCKIARLTSSAGAAVETIWLIDGPTRRDAQFWTRVGSPSGGPSEGADPGPCSGRPGRPSGTTPA